MSWPPARPRFLWAIIRRLFRSQRSPRTGSSSASAHNGGARQPDRIRSRAHHRDRAGAAACFVCSSRVGFRTDHAAHRDGVAARSMRRHVELCQQRRNSHRSERHCESEPWPIAISRFAERCVEPDAGASGCDTADGCVAAGNRRSSGRPAGVHGLVRCLRHCSRAHLDVPNCKPAVGAQAGLQPQLPGAVLIRLAPAKGDRQAVLAAVTQTRC